MTAWNRIVHGDCIEGMARMEAESVDCVLADPPYLYLKGQKLERKFDQRAFFTEVRRVLRPEGFIVLFGRGTVFYRQNALLADMGFKFKEEVVWDKRVQTTPYLPLGRTHETCTLHTKRCGKIRAVKEPYIMRREHDPEALAKDVERIMSAVGTDGKELRMLRDFVRDGSRGEAYRPKHTFNVAGTRTEKISVPVAVFASIRDGIRARDVMQETESRCGRIHPTQKPVRLLARLLRLVTDKGGTVVDPFCGSGSGCLACMDTGRKFLGFEIDAEYWAAAVRRMEAHVPSLWE